MWSTFNSHVMHSFRFRDVDIITSCGNYRCVCIKAVREALFVVMDFEKQSKLEKLKGKTLTTLVYISYCYNKNSTCLWYYWVVIFIENYGSIIKRTLDKIENLISQPTLPLSEKHFDQPILSCKYGRSISRFKEFSSVLRAKQSYKQYENDRIERASRSTKRVVMLNERAKNEREREREYDETSWPHFYPLIFGLEPTHLPHLQ